MTACMPFWPWVFSKVTLAPSSRDLNPLPSMPE